MRLHLVIGAVPWDTLAKKIPPYVAKFRERAVEMFSAYKAQQVTVPPFNYERIEMQVAGDDPQVEQLIRQFDQELKRAKPAVAALVDSILEAGEEQRARFLELCVAGGSADLDAKSEPLNKSWPVACEACEFPDLTRVPKPYLVGKEVLKKAEVFSTITGMLIVRPRVLEILRRAIGEQIEVGEAQLVDARKALDEPVFWVRPLEKVGDEGHKARDQQCPRCKRFLHQWRSRVDDVIEERGGGVYDLRKRLEHFGTGKADLALVGYFGGIGKDTRLRYGSWTVAISGALLAHLKASGVKGIRAAAETGDPVRCFLSAKGETAMESEARTFAATAKEPATRGGKRAAASKRKPATAAAMKNVPWDFDEKGYVYFYLSTPEVVVLDPSIWESDADGPLRVEKFTKPGLYRMHVSAIKRTKDANKGVSVEGGALLFVDNAFVAELQDVFDWSKGIKDDGAYDWTYYHEIATRIGNRFAVCTPPPRKLKSQFAGDGVYRIEGAGIEAVKVEG
jgi:hypothetical protein